MSKLVAAILAFPLLGFVFFYFFTYQQKVSTEYEIERLKFEQEWSERQKNSPFLKESDRLKHEQRAAEAEKQRKELERKKNEKDEKLEKLTTDFEQALEQALKDGKEVKK